MDNQNAWAQLLPQPTMPAGITLPSVTNPNAMIDDATLRQVLGRALQTQRPAASPEQQGNLLLNIGLGLLSQRAPGETALNQVSRSVSGAMNTLNADREAVLKRDRENANIGIAARTADTAQAQAGLTARQTAAQTMGTMAQAGQSVAQTDATRQTTEGMRRKLPKELSLLDAQINAASSLEDLKAVQLALEQSKLRTFDADHRARIAEAQSMIDYRAALASKLRDEQATGKVDIKQQWDAENNRAIITRVDKRTGKIETMVAFPPLGETPARAEAEARVKALKTVYGSWMPGNTDFEDKLEAMTGSRDAKQAVEALTQKLRTGYVERQPTIPGFSSEAGGREPAGAAASTPRLNAAEPVSGNTGGPMTREELQISPETQAARDSQGVEAYVASRLSQNPTPAQIETEIKALSDGLRAKDIKPETKSFLQRRLTEEKAALAEVRRRESLPPEARGAAATPTAAQPAANVFNVTPEMLAQRQRGVGVGPAELQTMLGNLRNGPPPASTTAPVTPATPNATTTDTTTGGPQAENTMETAQLLRAIESAKLGMQQFANNPQMLLALNQRLQQLQMMYNRALGQFGVR